MIDPDLTPPHRRRDVLRSALTTALWCGTGASAFAAAGPQPVPWPRQRPTPALALPAWDGSTWSLASARRNVVLVNFWASWCQPCRAEMPSLELLAQRHAEQGFQVVAVNFRETDGAIQRFIDETGLDLPLLRDRDGAAAKAFGVRVFPSTIVIGRDGQAVFSVVGEVDWTGAEARRWLAPVLSTR
jgi:thiol-disulfide isomerase/thioredoxin